MSVELWPTADSEAGECPACGGPAGLLGALGRLLWFRCRNCGSDFSESLEPEEGGLDS